MELTQKPAPMLAYTSTPIESVALVAKPVVLETPPAPKPCGITPGDYSVERSMVVAEFGSDAPVMVDIAEAESQFDPTADNCASTADGLFQILDGTWIGAGCGPLADKKKAIPNIRCARIIYNDSGTRPWLASAHNW